MASTVSGKGIDHYKWHRLLSGKASTVKSGIACLRKGKLPRRHSYYLNFKLKIVAEAVNNNREIAREYGISESMAWKWRNQQDVLFSGFNTLIGILLRQ